MAILFQLTCLLLLLGTIHNWAFPVIFERQFPLTYVHRPVEGDSGPFSIFDEMNKMMAGMHERVEHMFGSSSHLMNDYDDYNVMNDEYKLNHIDDLLDIEKKLDPVHDVIEIRKQLDTVVPVCTSITDLPTTISPRKSRRKKLRSTITTTCIKELIVNGQKHFSEEITTTDDKGVLISQSKSHGAVAMDQDEKKSMINSNY